jgi:hypothetical protein
MVGTMKVDSRNAVVERRFQEPVASVGPKPQQWEYRSALLERDAALDQFGSEGWELVGVTNAGADQGVFYFKRRRP